MFSGGQMQELGTSLQGKTCPLLSLIQDGLANLKKCRILLNLYLSAYQDISIIGYNCFLSQSSDHWKYLKMEISCLVAVCYFVSSTINSRHSLTSTLVVGA
jgi:uncharacterized membrane protein